MLTEHGAAFFQKVKHKATKEELEAFKGITVLSLQVVGTMTNDEATLKKFSLEDLVSVSMVVLTQLKELKPTEKQLSDSKYMQETFIPKVIEAISKPKK